MHGDHDFVLERVKNWGPSTIEAFRFLNLEYFTWMDREFKSTCGLSLAEIVGKSVEQYVDDTVALARSVVPSLASLSFLHTNDGQLAAMGGLRTLPDGAAEIVRIFTRPIFRGRGFATAMLQQLIADAGQSGYEIIRLDTGTFMHSAQKIYRNAGFSLCEPYAGAEPPEVLRPYWLYMERPVRISS